MTTAILVHTLRVNEDTCTSVIWTAGLVYPEHMHHKTITQELTRILDLDRDIKATYNSCRS